MQTRERIQRMLDDLPDGELDAVERFLAERHLTAQALPPALANAPEDDEPVTPEDEAAIEQAYADIAAGRVLSHAEVRRRLLGRP